MTCERIQDLLLDSTESEGHCVASHVAECADCREFQAALSTLDSKLAAAVPSAKAPVNARERILRLIDREEAMLADKAARLAEAEAAYQLECAQLRHGYLSEPKRWIDWIAWLSSALAFSLLLVWVILHPPAAHWSAQWTGGPGALGSAMAAVVCVIASLVFYRQLPRRAAAGF